MMDAIVILLVVVIAYIWSSRGFLSGFMHMLCVIVAGALAFSVWEPVGLWILGQQGGQDGYALNLSWGVALGAPFMIILTVLRLAMDKLVPGNTDVEGVVNLVGGGLCGAVSGVIVMGMTLMSVGYTRMSSDLYGYQPVKYDNGGSLTVQSDMVLPVEKWTAGFYKMLSNGAMRPMGGESLGRWHPQLAYEGALLRTNFEEGKAKHAIAPDGFEVIKHYTYAPTDSKQLLSDTFDDKRQQQFAYLNGETVSAGTSQIEGFVVSFKAGAKEKTGNVVLGPGQLHLVVQTDPNDLNATMGVQPLAIIAQSLNKPDVLRWRWDAPNTFFQSVGGAAEATMGFEFVVPKGSKPIGLYVKGTRVDVTQMAATPTFTSASERDSQIRSKAIFGKSAGKVDASRAVTVRIRRDDPNAADVFITTGTSVPFGIILQKDNLKGLTITEQNEIDGGGLVQFPTEDLKKTGFVDRKLQVRQFAATDDTRIVQVQVDGKNTRYGFLSDAAGDIDRTKPPVLIDSAGTTYSPVGYVFRNNEQTDIYFSPQAPVQSINSLPVVSRSRPDAQLVLIYRVNFGATVTMFAVGDRAIAKYDPGYKVGQQ